MCAVVLRFLDTVNSFVPVPKGASGGSAGSSLRGRSRLSNAPARAGRNDMFSRWDHNYLHKLLCYPKSLRTPSIYQSILANNLQYLRLEISSMKFALLISYVAIAMQSTASVEVMPSSAVHHHGSYLFLWQGCEGTRISVVSVQYLLRELSEGSLPLGCLGMSSYIGVPHN
ncbi:hypothetical protein CPB84DRAFT_357800 [Gymnopilus junonius]|uniref:Uncharacterized protein n=1 Tax=Gymnopilus junonius TaxID=109634 RepID=A0A9P5NC82_GYMJU|nr:hypothetical protein CPB84DRAFT_357800 [Gymnopilus junonius]